jgi:hypothetical protein
MVCTKGFRGSGEVLPRTTVQYRAPLRRRSSAHWEKEIKGSDPLSSK